MKINDVMRIALQNGGGTFYYDIGSLSFHEAALTDGYFVSDPNGLEIDLNTNTVNIADILGMVYNKEMYGPSNNAGLYLGLWVDNKTNILYVDCSRHMLTRRNAMRIARLNSQLAIWDIAQKSEIILPSEV